MAAADETALEEATLEDFDPFVEAAGAEVAAAFVEVAAVADEDATGADVLVLFLPPFLVEVVAAEDNSAATEDDAPDAVKTALSADPDADAVAVAATESVRVAETDAAESVEADALAEATVDDAATDEAAVPLLPPAAVPSAVAEK